ncbi:RIIA lysis inhibitor [Klebsiella phage phi1_175008]|uniref:Uncharacterized protein n=2 Tax=Klebsiella phage phi1_175008 TaxID=3127744 RepID=A0AC61ZTC4_9CAUD
MKSIQLSILETYVAHWGWWQGVRELIQNAVDTKDYEVDFEQGQICIKSYGGKIPTSALLLGSTTKIDDDSTIGKFGEGMKLGFLVLQRLGAEIHMVNGTDVWKPRFAWSEDFGANCLTVDIHEDVVLGNPDAVSITIKNIPNEAILEIKDKYAPCQNLQVVVENSVGKAYSKNGNKDCRLFVNGIFVTVVPGRFKFDYDFKPSAFVLDRDRDSANTFEVKYEASKLLSNCEDILLLAELGAENYDDIEHFTSHRKSGYFSGYYESEEYEDPDHELSVRASKLFEEKHGYDAFPINASWDSKKKRLVSQTVIKKGWCPVEVKQTLYTMIERQWAVDSEIENMLDFQPLEFLERFHSKHKRQLKAKANRELERVIEMLKIIAK